METRRLEACFSAALLLPLANACSGGERDALRPATPTPVSASTPASATPSRYWMRQGASRPSLSHVNAARALAPSPLRLLVIQLEGPGTFTVEPCVTMAYWWS